ncbi:MAG TPA: SRPBCC family protein [Acidimicrobiales bacterium]|nr:SRPBCC family protein [Acidimicrobiales bacterium]
MADQATQTIEIDAPSDRVFEVLLDLDAYPTWARDLKGVTVESRDDQGRARDVTFRAAAMGRSTSYTLRYSYDDEPRRMTWELVRGDITRRIDGSYTLEPVPGHPSRTNVTYDLTVDLIVPLPGFVKRRAEAKIVNAALRELRAHLE